MNNELSDCRPGNNNHELQSVSKSDLELGDQRDPGHGTIYREGKKELNLPRLFPAITETAAVTTLSVG